MTDTQLQPRPLKDLWLRLASALGIGVAFIGSTVFLGPMGLAAVVAIVAVAGAAEFYAILRRERRGPNEFFGLLAAALMPFAASQFGPDGLTGVVSALVIAALVWHISFSQVRASDTAVTVFGAVYVGFTLAHLVLIRELDAGTELVLATLVSVWANDTFAYLIGSTLGHHRMALFTTGVWIAVYFVTDTGISLLWLVLVGVSASIAAVVGDLAESRLKREAQMKDSSGWLPGHGGFLDRFDSMILVSIVTYYMLVLAGAQ